MILREKKKFFCSINLFFRRVQCLNKNERNRTIQHTQFNDFKNNIQDDERRRKNMHTHTYMSPHQMHIHIHIPARTTNRYKFLYTELKNENTHSIGMYAINDRIVFPSIHKTQTPTQTNKQTTDIQRYIYTAIIKHVHSSIVINTLNDL